MKIFFAILLMSMNLMTGTISNEKENIVVTRSIPFDDDFSLIVTNSDDERLNVKYDVKEKDIYVECNVKNFSFNKEKAGSLKQEGEGHIQLYLNNNKVDSIFTPSFIIKDLPIGVYKIKVELVHNDYTPYGIYEEFEVEL
jgi:hypothetical protein